MGFQDAFLGSGERFDYASLCLPTYPCAPKESKKALNFYGKGTEKAGLNISFCHLKN